MKIWAQYFLSVYCSNEISFTPEILSVSYYSLCSDFIVMILIFCLNKNLPVCFNKHFESPKKLLINGTRLDWHINIAILTRWTNSHSQFPEKKSLWHGFPVYKWGCCVSAQLWLCFQFPGWCFVGLQSNIYLFVAPVQPSQPLCSLTFLWQGIMAGKMEWIIAD